jgi:hypothetical protein
MINNNTLLVQLKVQDRYRKWFSGLGTEIPLSSTCVIFGDSDIDYELAPNVGQSRILSAPFNCEGIKYKLLYNGVGKNLSGIIKCFTRTVLSTGDIQSYYDYPNSDTLSTGRIPPTLNNGVDTEQLTFTNDKMGYILFFSTVLDYYFDVNGVKERLVEDYNFSIDWNDSDATPTGWDFVIDNKNGSMLISKDITANPVGSTYNGTITVTGQFSNKIKKVKFNL